MCSTHSQEIKVNVQSVGFELAQLEDFNFISCYLQLMLLLEDCFQATNHDVIQKHRQRNQRRKLWIKFGELFQKKEKSWGFVHTVRQLSINWPLSRGHFGRDKLWWPLSLWRGCLCSEIKIRVSVLTFHRDQESGLYWRFDCMLSKLVRLVAGRF